MRQLLAQECWEGLWFQPAEAWWVCTGLNYLGHIFFPWHLPSNNKSTDVVVLIRLYHDICRHFTCFCLQTQPRNRLISEALTHALGLSRALSQTTGGWAQAPSTSCWYVSQGPPTPLLEGRPLLSRWAFLGIWVGGGGSFLPSCAWFLIGCQKMPEKSLCLKICLPKCGRIHFSYRSKASKMKPIYPWWKEHVHRKHVIN